jgi:hypothetical protein
MSVEGIIDKNLARGTVVDECAVALLSRAAVRARR